MSEGYTIASFYRFETLSDLPSLKRRLAEAMETHSILGTIIIAEEGFNATVSALAGNMERFLEEISEVLGGLPNCKFSRCEGGGFQRQKVKIKKEIVTFKSPVDMRLGAGTHVSPEDWDEVVSDPATILIDARNDYEYKVGTFRGAVNPGTEAFSELPDYVESNLSPVGDPAIAMFCTGGIRCEKLAPYLVEKGFHRVYQLDGGILNYLESTGNRSGLWEGECFVFDERVTVDDSLRKGLAPDFSSLKSSSIKSQEKGE